MMVLPGMHGHIQTWDQVLTARYRSTGALDHRIHNDMFTPDDEKRLDIQWTPQPCQRRPVRVTLKVTEDGTWYNLSAAHRDMVGSSPVLFRPAQLLRSYPVCLSCRYRIQGPRRAV